MTTDELSILGYCWTGSVVSARQPTSTIARLTTIASTGWRMKTSVNERIGWFLVGCGGRRRSVVLTVRGRRGVGPGVGLDLGDGDRHGLEQLERPGGRHLFAGGEAFQDRDVVAEHGAALHRALVRARFLVFAGGDDEHVVAAWTLAQRADGDGDDALRRGPPHAHP